MTSKRVYYTMNDLGINKDVLLAVMDGDMFDDKLLDLLFYRHSNDWAAYADVNINPWDTTEPEPEKPAWDLDWLPRFQFIYETTKDRYRALLNAYETEKDHLMAKIESTTFNQFNDTPQDGGDFSTTGYASNVTKTTTSVDSTTAMNRLSEVYNLYRDLYYDWVEEFNDLFGEM